MAKTNGADVETRLTKEEKPLTLETWLEQRKPDIIKALPQHMKADRFLRVILTTLRLNTKLAACNQASFLGAMMTSAQLGLEVNTPLGEAFIIPYGKEAQFQVGYQGILSLAYRTNQYAMVYAMEVYKNDKFDFWYGLNPDLIHKPAKDPEGEPTHYYAVYHLANGGKAFRVWTKEKIIVHAKKFSASYKAGGDSPWKTDFDSMAKKTVLKDLFKYAPKSVEFARALTLDETVKTELSMDMDLTPDETVIEAEVVEKGDTHPETTGEQPAAQATGQTAQRGMFD